MTAFTRSALRDLIELDLHPAVSVLMPRRPTDVKMSQDSIRLKTLTREARRQLAEHGLEKAFAERVLAPLLDRVDDAAFWRRHAGGLAFFIAPNFFREHGLAWPLREAVVTGPRFWLKPLLPALLAEETFYVLALSQHDVRLIEATAATAREVDLGDLPAKMREALAYEPPGQNLQRHVVTRAGGQLGTAVHGHLPGLDRTKELSRHCFHLVDRALSRLLPDPRVPLVVTAVEYLHAIYREISTHPGTVPEAVLGSPDGMANEVLAARAWEIVRPRLETPRHAARARYEEAGPRLTATDLPAVLTAAAQGRVVDLFVATDVEVWGSFDPETGSLGRADSPGPGVEDLLNLAVIYTIQRAGAVHAVAREDVPCGDSGVAALFRY